MRLFNRKKRQAARESKSQEQSKPAPMFSYHAQRSTTASSERSQPNQPEAKSRSSRHHWQHIPTLLAAVIIIMAVGYSLTLSTTPKVIILGHDNSSSLLRGDALVYQKLMQSELEKSIFNRGKLTLDTNKLTRTLKQQYPEFSDLAVVIPLIGRRPVIQVRPTQIVFMLSNSNGLYLIDKEGRAVMEAQASSQTNQSVPTVIDQTGVDVTIGQNVLPKETLAFMTEVIGQLQTKNLQIEKMTLPALANELHVKLLGQPYYIKFNMEGDARQQVGTYFALQGKLTAEKITPGEYVDVRVDEKAFYR